MAEHATDLLNTIAEDSRLVRSFVESIVSRFDSGDLLTDNGISFLELKNATLLNYLVNLSNLMLNKCNGKKMEDSVAVERLVENRVVLEKIRPINEKLKYQIDKLVKMSKTDISNENDPLSLKPKPENLDVDDGESDGDEDEVNGDENVEEDGDENETDEPASKSKSKVYVPPRLAAVRYDGDETLKDKKKKLLERAKKRAMSSSLIQELRGEFDEAPEEVSDFNFARKRYNNEAKQRKRYEEDYFTRLNIPKKKQNKSLVTISSLSDDVTKFEDISALEIQNVDNFNEKKRKKSSVKQKGKFSTKKGKKFRRK